MGKIKGTTVILYDKIEVGLDGFNKPIFTENKIEVDNILISSPTTDDISDALNLYGKKIEYILGIPKTDNNQWEDRKVRFFDKDFMTIGFIEEGIAENIPSRIPWHKKIKVVKYE